MPASGANTIDVLLTTEGTYPVARGGVSTWCDMLVRGIPGVRYQVYAVVANPYLPDCYRLPEGLKVIRVPMWGTEQPSDHLDLPFSRIYERKVRTTDAVVQEEFLPLFDQIQAAIWTPRVDGLRFGRVLHDLYRWFGEFDYQAAMKSPQVWSFYTDGLQANRWTKLPAPPTLDDSLQTLGWLYRFLVILNTPVPRSDVTHASAAAFAGLPGVFAKLDRQTPYVLTEHGVYLREQYHSVGGSRLSLFAKRFLTGLVRGTVAANYAYADIVAPVAAFNARWERHFGVPEEKIRVIYNGVDPDAFSPQPRAAGAPPMVVAVARIDPQKDIVTLLRAASLVHQRIPEAKFAVYGGVSVPSYYQECLALRAELGLDEAFMFAGHVDDAPSAYASGDVAVLSSVSEGFPFSVVEAMMSGRALVATDVGGTREACAGVGLLVEPRNPAALADAIMRLLRDPALRASLAEQARERALAYFTVQRNLQLYRETYASLLAQQMQAEGQPGERQSGEQLGERLSELVARRRLLALDRARALQASGQIAQAIREYRVAADLDPTGPATPTVLLTVAELYLLQGDIHSSWREIERAETLARALELLRAG